MGKSAAARLFAARGVPVVDTDVLARELVAPGQPALGEIVACFGSAMLDASGGLDRGSLAEIVFADATSRQRLEAILHPRIRERWLAATRTWAVAGRPMGVVVIPLLFETAAETAFQVTLCVACTAATQRRRLDSRGWSDAESDRRLAAQWPVERKMSLARHVLWNESSLAVLDAQLDRILAGM